MELKERQGLFPTLWLCQNDVWPGVNLCPEGRAGNHYSSLGKQEGKLRLAFWEDTRARACPLLIDMCLLQWRQPTSIWGILLSASQERNSEGEAGSLAKQSGVQFPERDHSVFVGTREGAWGCKKVEGQSGSCIFLFTSSGLASPIFSVAPFFGSSESERTLCGYYTVGFFLPFSSPDSLLWGQEVRRWSSQAGSTLSSNTQTR